MTELRESTISHENWEEIWNSDSNLRSFYWWLKRDREGIRGRKIFSFLRDHVGELDKIKIIEVGSGMGVFSFIFASLGADVTLMDYSNNALNQAKKIFNHNGLFANYIHMDARNITPQLHGKFDVAMSFGTVEHYPDYFFIAKSHLDLVRRGGGIIISVPNRFFILHEILKLYLQFRGKWDLGYEKAFSKKELFTLGEKLGLKHQAIQGSSTIMDFISFIHIFKSRPRIVPLNRYKEKSSFLDDYLGASLFLMGCKS
ncbi:methyltransferase domain-containing protein [Candidatus Poribacteria bacterium]|nr:methyltransferase domain-containing protein [Candidatus Poribacteria bacterium]